MMVMIIMIMLMMIIMMLILMMIIIMMIVMMMIKLFPSPHAPISKSLIQAQESQTNPTGLHKATPWQLYHH